MNQIRKKKQNERRQKRENMVEDINIDRFLN